MEQITINQFVERQADGTMPQKKMFASGRHIAAARTMAGLTQSELAEIAGLHRNSLARLERMERIPDSMSASAIHQALRELGVICQTRPVIAILMRG